jgi:hypothetical protein
MSRDHKPIPKQLHPARGRVQLFLSDSEEGEMLTGATRNPKHRKRGAA